MSVAIENKIKEVWGLENSQIKIEYPGITKQELVKFYTNLKSSNLQVDLNIKICEICDDLLKYQPETFDQFLIYYKAVCAVFLSQQSGIDICILQYKVNILHKAFTLNILNWDHNPVILHIICKSIFEVTENHKNIIYFAKKISTISQTSFYISVCLMWTVFFKILNIDKKMSRFHKFSTLIETLENIQIEKKIQIMITSI